MFMTTGVADITDAVQKFWSFLWPSACLVTSLSAAAYFTAGDTVRAGVARLRSLVTGERISQAEAALNMLVLKPLLPVTALFVILFILFATLNLVLLIGAALPPTVVFEPDCVIAASLEDGEIACLRRQFSPS